MQFQQIIVNSYKNDYLNVVYFLRTFFTFLGPHTLQFLSIFKLSRRVTYFFFLQMIFRQIWHDFQVFLSIIILRTYFIMQRRKIQKQLIQVHTYLKSGNFEYNFKDISHETKLARSNQINRTPETRTCEMSKKSFKIYQMDLNKFYIKKIITC